MRTTSIKSEPKKVKNIDFAPIYTSKSKVKNKYIPAFAVFFVLIIGVFALSSMSPPDNAQASTNEPKKDAVKEVQINNSEVEKVDKAEESCTESTPQFDGIRTQTCDGENYKKTYECFDDETAFDETIYSYELKDETYLIDNVIFREGSIDSTYRIMAAFKNTKCIINLTSTIENKAELSEVFDAERENAREVQQDSNS